MATITSTLTSEQRVNGNHYRNNDRVALGIIIRAIRALVTDGVGKNTAADRKATAAKFISYRNGQLVRIGARVRNYAASDLASVEFKRTHSDRTRGEPSEFDRATTGPLNYFVQLYAGDEYVVLDLDKMRDLGLFNDGQYTIVNGNSNGGNYSYAEYSLASLYRKGVVANASPRINAFFK
jgi:hypothetical protein